MIDVIIPVYKGYKTTLACIESVLQAKVVCGFRVIVIDDASPDPLLPKALQEYQSNAKIHLLTNKSNIGFTSTVNKGMTYSSNDVVLLNSDTIVSDFWLDRLVWHLDGQQVATVTPLSNNATICSFPVFLHDNPVPSLQQLSHINHVAARVNQGCSVEVPTAVGFCMAISREVIDLIGFFDDLNFPRGYGEENDFSRRASKAGWKNIFATDLYVAHEGGVSFMEEAGALQLKHGKRLVELHPEYDRLVQEHIKSDPASIYRDRLQEALEV